MPQVVLQEPLVISDTGNKICVAQVPSKEKRAFDAATDPARPHKCCVCQAAFRKISHLKQHHLRHTGERPYKCTKCDRCIYYCYYSISVPSREFLENIYNFLFLEKYCFSRET